MSEMTRDNAKNILQGVKNLRRYMKIDEKLDGTITNTQS